VDRAEAIKFLQREEEISDLKAVMGTVEGRRFIWRQLGEANIFAPCYTPEAEGARRKGLLLLGEIIENCSDNYLIMQREVMDNEAKKRTYADEERKAADIAFSNGDLDDWGEW
jgi:hypothetical protein